MTDQRAKPIFVCYDERNFNPPKIEFWTEAQFKEWQNRDGFGFGDGLITGGDISCVVKMRFQRDYKAAMKKAEVAVTAWLVKHSVLTE